MSAAKFTLGQICVAPGVLQALDAAGQDPIHFLTLHAAGAWGDLSREDREANEQAVAHEAHPELRDRVLSSYRTRTGTILWVITEQDRSATTILLPDEY